MVRGAESGAGGLGDHELVDVVTGAGRREEERHGALYEGTREREGERGREREREGEKGRERE